MTPAYVGVDVAFAKKKALPVCICLRENGRLVPLPLRRHKLRPPRGGGNVATLDEAVVSQFARDARAYIARVARDEGLSIVRIGVDAPREYRAEERRRRASDAAMDRAGISCFATPSRSQFEQIRSKVGAHLAAGGAVSRLPHANQLWMLVGFALFRQLATLAECIEVFPQATARTIGAGQIHKFKAGGVSAQLAAAAKHTGWPSSGKPEPSFDDVCIGPAHDRLDAYLSAWVASLDESERVAFGDPPNDVIWVPRVEPGFHVPAPSLFRPVVEPVAAGSTPIRLRQTREATRESLPVPQGVLDPSGLTANDVAQRRVLCPACRSKVFSVWPYGWDAHAAHRCDGLSESDPVVRKREFKERFAELFRGGGGKSTSPMNASLRRRGNRQ